ncbi:MAG: invasion associated locus B family protein [Methyloceanibacter sp.]
MCGKEGDPKTAEERCSLVLPLIEKETQKLIFRMILVYGPKGNLVLRVDDPTGVALQRGVQISTNLGKVYGLLFQTCLPLGCKALNIVADDIRQDLKKSNNATIVVHALHGKQIQTVAELKGLDLGLAALDKKTYCVSQEEIAAPILALRLKPQRWRLSGVLWRSGEGRRKRTWLLGLSCRHPSARDLVAAFGASPFTTDETREHQVRRRLCVSRGKRIVRKAHPRTL